MYFRSISSDDLRNALIFGTTTACSVQTCMSKCQTRVEATRALEAVGVDRKQAEAHAEQLRAAAGADIDQLATKIDIGWLRWIAGINLAPLAAVLGLAWKLLP